MDYSTPYALYVQRCRETISDYTFLTSLQAFIDNAHDAGGPINMKSARIGTSDYLAIENDFSFMTNLESYFGMGKVTKKKENQLGQTSCGALKALCYLAPTSVTLISAEARQKPASLKFSFADYLHAIDVCESYTHESVNVSKFITSDESTINIASELSNVTKDRRLAAILSILDRTVTSYFLIVMEFSDKHSLYGKLDMNLDKNANTLGLLYSSFLGHRFSISYETSSGKYCKMNNNANSDIVLGNPCLWIQASVLQDSIGKIVLNISVSVYGNKQEGSSTFMVDGTSVLSSANTTSFKEIGQFHVKFGYVKSSEANEQSLLFNFDGVVTSWNGRRSAHTYWNYVLNSIYKTKPITTRCEVFVEHNRQVYRFLGSGNIHHAHPVAKQFFDMIMINLANDNNKLNVSKDLFSLLQTPL
jgi:hypothetical protein